MQSSDMTARERILEIYDNYTLFDDRGAIFLYNNIPKTIWNGETPNEETVLRDLRRCKFVMNSGMSDIITKVRTCGVDGMSIKSAEKAIVRERTNIFNEMISLSICDQRGKNNNKWKLLIDKIIPTNEQDRQDVSRFKRIARGARLCNEQKILMYVISRKKLPSWGYRLVGDVERRAEDLGIKVEDIPNHLSELYNSNMLNDDDGIETVVKSHRRNKKPEKGADLNDKNTPEYIRFLERNKKIEALVAEINALPMTCELNRNV